MDWAALLSIVANIIASASAKFSRDSAIATRDATMATRDAAEAAILNGLLVDYFSEAMEKDLALLGEHRNQADLDKWAAEWIKNLRSDNDAVRAPAQELNRARRRVKGFFYRAAMIVDTGLATDRVLDALMATGGADIFLAVVVPMELEYNRDVRGIQDYELFIPSVQLFDKVKRRFEMVRARATASSTMANPESASR